MKEIRDGARQISGPPGGMATTLLAYIVGTGVADAPKRHRQGVESRVRESKYKDMLNMKIDPAMFMKTHETATNCPPILQTKT